MVHVKLPLLNFKLDLEHENVDILKNGFYHRILQPSEYPKRERAKKNFFFETLLDGPLLSPINWIYYLFQNPGTESTEGTEIQCLGTKIQCLSASVPSTEKKALALSRIFVWH